MKLFLFFSSRINLLTEIIKGWGFFPSSFHAEHFFHHILQFFLQVKKKWDNFKRDVFILGAKEAQNIMKKLKLW